MSGGYIPKNAQERELLFGLKSLPRQWYVNHLTGVNDRNWRDTLAAMGLPAPAPEIDALVYTTAAWRWLSDHRALIRAAARPESEELSPKDQLALANVRLKELQYLEKCGELVSAQWIEGQLNKLAAKLKQLAETAQREYGPRAYDLVTQVIEDMQAEIKAIEDREGADVAIVAEEETTTDGNSTS